MRRDVVAIRELERVVVTQQRALAVLPDQHTEREFDPDATIAQAGLGNGDIFKVERG